MDGLVPTSGFLRFYRGETYKQNTKYDEVQIEKDLRLKRSAMHFKFWQASCNTECEDEDGHSVSMTGACQNLECMADRFALKSFSISNLSYFVFCL